MNSGVFAGSFAKWISAKWHGHFYCYCPEKVGGVRWATNKHPWDAYTPDALKCPRKGFAAGRKSSAETLTEMHPWAHSGPIVGRGSQRGAATGPH